MSDETPPADTAAAIQDLRQDFNNFRTEIGSSQHVQVQAFAQGFFLGFAFLAVAVPYLLIRRAIAAIQESSE